MLHGQKIIAFTPCGRKRYMDLLAAHVNREHEAGHIDEWILFNNAYVREDSTYVDQLAAQWPWIKVFREKTTGHGAGHDKFNWSRPEHISDFYKFMTEGNGVVYLRFDDDIVYIDPECVPKLIKYRLENPAPYLVFPTIINNVRTSHHLQLAGIASPEWGITKNDMNDEIGWKSTKWVFNLHQTALASLEAGTLVKDFTLKSEQFTDWEAGHISINSFAILGKDMLASDVHKDEEGYLSLWRPKALNRQNARCGDAIVIHFAYHTQTDFMDRSGMITDYAKFAPPLPFRTSRLEPDWPAIPQQPGMRAGRPPIVPLSAQERYLASLQHRGRRAHSGGAIPQGVKA